MEENNTKLRGRTIGQLAVVPEVISKTAALPGGVLALGGKGDLTDKIISGYHSLYTLPMDAYNTLSNMASLSQDYSNLTVREFTDKYGSDVAESTIQSSKGLVDFVAQSYENLADQPLTTLAAGVLTAGSLYGIARVIRFWRQKGRGSIFDRMERGIGEKLFKE